MITPAHVEAYCRMRSQRGYRSNPEEYVIFCELIERRLAKLSHREREILLLIGAGYTQKEVARIEGISLRTISRRMAEINVKAFSELAAWIGESAGIRNWSSFTGPKPRRAAS